MQNTQRNNQVLTFEKFMAWFGFVFKVYSECRGTDIVRRERNVVTKPLHEAGIKPLSDTPSRKSGRAFEQRFR